MIGSSPVGWLIFTGSCQSTTVRSAHTLRVGLRDVCRRLGSATGIALRVAGRKVSMKSLILILLQVRDSLKAKVGRLESDMADYVQQLHEAKERQEVLQLKIEAQERELEEVKGQDLVNESLADIGTRLQERLGDAEKKVCAMLLCLSLIRAGFVKGEGLEK